MNVVMERESFSEEIYKENIIDHYKNPRNKKELVRSTVRHRESNPVCGDEITIFIAVRDNIIEEISFMGNGCAISQASISMLTERVKGMSFGEVKKLSEQDILNMLGISISHLRLKCALLSLQTVQRGLEKQRSENA